MKKNLGVRSNVKGRRVFQTKKDDSRLTPRARRRARRASLLATRASRHEGMPFWFVTSGGGGDGPGPFDPPLARDVRERYTCALCLDLFKDPLYLHDAHAFCARCIVQLSERLGGRNVACPLCRRRCDVVKALPADDLAGALGKALVAVSRDDFLSGPAPGVRSRDVRDAVSHTTAVSATRTRARTYYRSSSIPRTPQPSPPRVPVSGCLGLFGRKKTETVTERARAARQSADLNSGRLILHGVCHATNSLKGKDGTPLWTLYPPKFSRREVQRYCHEHVAANRALGELDNPDADDGRSQHFLSLTAGEVSHHILELRWKGDLLMAYVEVLDTRAGRIVRDLVMSGFEPSMGSRGWASMRHTRVHSVVQSDFELITFDVLFGESNHGYTLAPLQRRYQNLPPPIDVGEKIEAFRRARGEITRDHRERRVDSAAAA